MVRRPFKDKRPVGPLFTNDDKDTRNANQVVTDDSGEPIVNDEGRVARFESIDDLPDSPMLMSYVEEVKEWSGNSEFEVINSKAVEDYMKKLGVWRQAIDGT